MIFGGLITWWKRLHRKRSFGRLFVVESMTSVPADPGDDIYIVRRRGLDRRAVLNCPCRCGRRIDVSLVDGQDVHWSVQIRNGKVSLHPSIWLRTDPCQSHFLVRDSKVIWV